MKLALSIAWRFLKSAKRQTLIIILGIAVGVSVQVFIGSLISGLQDSLVDSTIGSSSHITFTKTDDTFITDYEELLTTIKQQSAAITIASPTIDIGGILEKDIATKKEIRFRGFNFTEANKIYDFDKKLTEGNLPLLDNEILLGASLKEDLGVNVGDVIDFEFATIKYPLTISGFFDFNVAIINSTWGVSSLSTIQSILQITSSVTSIETQLSEVFDAQELSLTLNSTFIQDNIQTTNWMDENAELLSGLQGQSISSLMIQVFVIISVVLGIASVLAITVMQKSKQIGILKAMGIKDSTASLIFLFEGLILGIFGAIFGVLLGVGLGYSFATFALKPNGEPVIPLTIEVDFIILSAFIALAASTLAALIPARKSSKLTVIEVIRNA